MVKTMPRGKFDSKSSNRRKHRAILEENAIYGGMKEVSEITGVHVQNLYQWANFRLPLFNCVMFGCWHLKTYSFKNYTPPRATGPDQYCREQGLDGLEELSQLTGSAQWLLRRWHRDRGKLFLTVVHGAVLYRKQEYPEPEPSFL